MIKVTNPHNNIPHNNIKFVGNKSQVKRYILCFVVEYQECMSVYVGNEILPAIEFLNREELG